jgi:putative Ca2+/H+ antiporter (TMEM165/GDT1 family)
MLNVAVVAAVFAIVFLAELPDKSLFASLVLGTRYRPLHVWAGTAAAFVVHMAIAVAAGQVLVKLVPHRVLEAIVAALFVAGSAYLMWSSFRSAEHEGLDASRQGPRPPTFWQVAGMSFGVVFLAEWGDITQITVANLTARYADPLSVFLGGTLALWAVAGLAVTVGAQTLKLIPMQWIQRISGTILLGFGAYSAIMAVRG